MKTIKTFSKVITLTIFCVIFFSACFSYWAENEGTIVINFGSSASRSFYNPNENEGDYLNFIYEVYVRRAGSTNLTKVGEFEGESGQISVLPGIYTVILKAYDNNNGSRGILRGYGYSVNDNSKRAEVQVNAGDTIKVDVDLHSAVEVDTWDKLIEAVYDANDNNNSGRKLYIFINKDLDADSTAVIGGNITLIPNGNVTIENLENNKTLDGSSAMFQIGGQGSLSLGEPDMSGRLTLTGTEDPGNSLIVNYNSTLEMYDGITISGNTAYNGGGVSVFDNGRFYMHGGIISGNTAHYYGGGVYVDNGNFEKTGGIIYGLNDNQFYNKVFDIEDSNIPSKRGHAVYVKFYIDSPNGVSNNEVFRFRDDTCMHGEEDLIAGFGGFSGKWGGDFIKISTIQDLRNIEKDDDSVTENYILTNDIKISSGWAPISRFKGIFDGNGYTITFDEITNISFIYEGGAGDAAYYGLFGHIDGNAIVKNLILKGNISLNTPNYISNPRLHMGALAGINFGEITNVLTDVEITVSNNVDHFSLYIGGLVGYNCGPIKNCYNKGSIIINNNGNNINTCVGGISGLASGGYGNISYCISEGDIIINGTSTGSFGGIVGQGEYVFNCVALNESIIINNAIAIAGICRVVGISGSDPVLYNNHARSDMKLMNNGNNVTIQPAHDNVHGANLSVWDEAFWIQQGFTGAFWSVPGRLPIGGIGTGNNDHNFTFNINFDLFKEGTVLGFTDDAISISGTNGDTEKTITINDPEQYESIRWFFNGYEMEQSVSKTIRAEDCIAEYTNRLTVVLRKNGVSYSAEIAFEVMQ